MLNQFFIEREILNKTECLQQLVKSIRFEISHKVREKSEKYNLIIPMQLQKYLLDREDENSKRIFTCRICCKEFNDGRKLGGHMSRSHPFADKNSEEVIKVEPIYFEGEENCSKPKNRQQNIKLIQLPADSTIQTPKKEIQVQQSHKSIKIVKRIHKQNKLKPKRK